MATVTHLSSVETPQRQVRNVIENTVRPGQRVRVPLGSYVWTSQEGHISKRSRMVEVISVTDGWVDYNNTLGMGKGYVVLPEIAWRGSANYVISTKITPEFCGVNRLPAPYIPRAELRNRKLDWVPAFGPGYDNRDVI